jgi:hypothetical protein
VQTWPAFRKAAQAPPFAATSIADATSGQTMNGSLPPSSRLIRATRSAQMWAIFLPVSTEPVNATQSTRSSETIALPTSPAPARMLITPGGRCSKHSARASVESGVSSDGLATIVFPAASAGATFHDSSRSG